MDKPGTSFFTAVCHAWPCRVCAIHIQCYWYPRYWIFGHTIISTVVIQWLWKFTILLRTSRENPVWSSAKFCWGLVKLCHIKGCTTFLHHPINWLWWRYANCCIKSVLLCSLKQRIYLLYWGGGIRVCWEVWQKELSEGSDLFEMFLSNQKKIYIVIDMHYVHYCSKMQQCL